jgi:AcrR family transcriptional regulator
MLIAAAFELLGSQGWSATTVRGVCRRSGLNPRYFYESFGDLDELVVAVYDRVVGELTAEVTAAAEAAPDRAGKLRATDEQTVRFIDGDRRRARVLYVEALGNETLNRRRIETGRRLVGMIGRDAAPSRPGRSADPVALMQAAILVGGFTELLVAWLDGRLAVDREQLVEDATALFLGLAETGGNIARGRRAPTS